jgi:hypothetical protein
MVERELEVMKYLDKSAVEKNYGKSFADLLKDKKVHFTSDGAIVELNTPIHVIGELETIVSSTVKIPEPNVSQLKSVDSVTGEMAKSAILLSSVVGIPPNELDAMGSRDFMRLQKVMGVFLTDGQ